MVVGPRKSYVGEYMAGEHIYEAIKARKYKSLIKKSGGGQNLDASVQSCTRRRHASPLRSINLKYLVPVLRAKE